MDDIKDDRQDLKCSTQRSTVGDLLALNFWIIEIISVGGSELRAYDMARHANRINLEQQIAYCS